MPRFSHGEIELDYLDEGRGDPVLLVHGFASTKEVNWVGSGWVTALTQAGRRAIAFDNRGHGRSSKLYEPDAYRTDLMMEDARALLDHLGLARADVMGYSMGARITAFLASRHRGRVRAAILGGLGINLVDHVGLSPAIADGLDAPSSLEVTDPDARMFRVFAERTGSDLKALAACIRGSRQLMTREEVSGIAVPTLIAVGTRDDIAGDPRDLAALIQGSEMLDIPDRDHMLAVGDKVYKAAVLEFLARRP